MKSILSDAAIFLIFGLLGWFIAPLPPTHFIIVMLLLLLILLFAL